jgi:hypothetical protein
VSEAPWWNSLLVMEIFVWPAGGTAVDIGEGAPPVPRVETRLHPILLGHWTFRAIFWGTRIMGISGEGIFKDLMSHGVTEPQGRLQARRIIPISKQKDKNEMHA